MKTTPLFLMAILMVAKVFGQDIHFSQFNESPLFINPAMTGFFEGSQRIGLNNKSQWRNVGNAYNTYALSYDVGLNKGRNSSGFLALGAGFFNDISGDLNLSNLSGLLNIAYHLRLNPEQMLSAGIYGGFGQRSIDQSNAQWSSQYDGVSGFDGSLSSNETISFESFGYVDIGFGLNWSLMHNARNMSSNDGLKVNAGFSVHHVNQPAFDFIGNSDMKLNMKMLVHTRAQIGLDGTNAALVPMFFLQLQGKQKEILPGISVRYQLRERSKYTGFIKDAYASLGVIYRTSDAVIIQSGLELNDFALGLSYDINISGLSTATNGNGGLEVSLRYIIPDGSGGNKSFY